jgi:hypothetical protein
MSKNSLENRERILRTILTEVEKKARMSSTTKKTEYYLGRLSLELGELLFRIALCT